MSEAEACSAQRVRVDAVLGNIAKRSCRQVSVCGLDGQPSRSQHHQPPYFCNNAYSEWFVWHMAAPRLDACECWERPIWGPVAGRSVWIAGVGASFVSSPGGAAHTVMQAVPQEGL